MKDFIIIADAACDLSPELQSEYGVVIAPGHIGMPDKTELLSTPGWESWSSSDDFYNELKKNPDGYSTSPANVAEFAEIFEKYVSDGKDVLAISLSSGISGSFNFMNQAKDKVLQSHPNAKIYCIDSLRYSTAFGLLAIYAANLRKDGKTIEETVTFIENNKIRFHQAGWLDDLTFLAKKGRINNASAFFGTLIGIKPIGEFDKNGLTTVLVKAKGAKNAYNILLGYIEETIENPEEQLIFIAQTNRMKQALEYKAMIEERFHPKAVIVTDVFPLCGINIGPGLMAAYYMGKPISDDLATEREILEKLANN